MTTGTRHDQAERDRAQRYAERNPAAAMNGIIQAARARVAAVATDCDPLDIQAEHILAIVAVAHGLHPRRMATAKTREQRYAQPRQVAAALLKDTLGLSYRKIAEMLHRKDHSTIVHAAERGREHESYPQLYRVARRYLRECDKEARQKLSALAGVRYE